MQNKEKRRDDRYSCYVPVMCKKGTMFDQSQTTNISSGGAGFVTHRFIPVKTKMMVEISLTPDSEPIMAVGEVMWVQHVANSDNYRIGLKFIEISSPVKSRLEKYFVH